MNELLANMGIAFVSIGILIAYLEWRNRRYTQKITTKIDTIAQKLIDLKYR